jgi:DNA-binding transcriptional LysR family regulator
MILSARQEKTYSEQMRPISQSFRCLDAVARRGSVRKAAEALHLTAAAVHQQILNFEEQVGTPLFDRLPRGMKLTAAGEIVLASVRRAQRDYEQALAQVEALRTLKRGHVSLGVPHASAELLLPRVLQAMHADYPGISFDVRTGNGEALLRAVAGGEVDIAFCLQRMAPPGVEQIRAWPQQLGAVVAPDHPLAQRAGKLRLRDCLAHALALPAPDMELRAMVDRIASRERQLLKPVVQTTSVAMIRTLAADGGLVGLLVQENIFQDVEAGRLRWLPLADAEAQSAIGLYQRLGQRAAVATGVFVQYLDRAFQEWVAPP